MSDGTARRDYVGNVGVVDTNAVDEQRPRGQDIQTGQQLDRRPRAWDDGNATGPEPVSERPRSGGD
jgi:hypothetical protein